MKQFIQFSIMVVLFFSAFSAESQNNPDGFELVAYEGESKTFSQPVDLAYGANGRYLYINDFTGTIRFDNQAFGGDPIEGVNKAGYMKRSYNSQHGNQHGNQDVNDYQLVANEGEIKVFSQPVDLAYGANGKYHYIKDFTGTIRFNNQSFGGDPIEGVTKAGYMKRAYNSQQGDQDISEYKFAANEGETKTYRRPVDLAYGANGRYHYINDFTGTIRFDNQAFGGDPIKGVNKTGYMKPSNDSQYGNQNGSQDINEYKFAANEGETKTYRRPVDLAYGADGRYFYINDFTGTIRFDNQAFGGDPIEGVNKAGYMKRSNDSQHGNQHDNQDMNEFKFIANEGESKTFHQPVDLAYGANGKFYYINDFTGSIRFDNNAFGGDPIPGQKKQGYVRETNYRKSAINPKYEANKLKNEQRN